ncbi:MAG TPA: tetratricopeptide repeat protein [Myxococcales bacterium]|nr:tetratricopeptide repeat protein [Myxococcales bacterium]
MRHLLCVPLAVGCAVTQPKRLVIPEEMRRPLATGPSVAEATATPGVIYTQPRTTTKNPFSDTVGIATDDLTKPKVFPAPAAGTPATPVTKAAAAPHSAAPVVPTDPAQRYTLRLVEHGRVWEVELPESTGGYEVRIPLGTGIETPTEADQEMLGKTPPPGRSKSYLGTLAKVGEMYKSHRYELALIEVVDLEQQYPKDPRLLAMKGSLYQKLGKTTLARDAWKKALEIDPSDTTVAEALRALKED